MMKKNLFPKEQCTMLNDRGNMCILGFLAKELGAASKKIRYKKDFDDAGIPKINLNYEKVLDINDDDQTTDYHKQKLLRKEFKLAGYQLLFIT